MRRIIFLDAGPLGMACNDSMKDEANDFRNWMWVESTNGSEIVIPEIADYEIRRKLLEKGLRASLDRLDNLCPHPAFYLPIATDPMRKAAELWAQARRGGEPTSGESSIDADVILSAQVLKYCSDADDWWVATGNEKHLSRYLGDRARYWRNIAPSTQ